MDDLASAWLYPIILLAGALQAWGPPMNNALKRLWQGLASSVRHGHPEVSARGV
jgi:hypothetical protein